jgi:hypothetical protein
VVVVSFVVAVMVDRTEADGALLAATFRLSRERPMICSISRLSAPVLSVGVVVQKLIGESYTGPNNARGYIRQRRRCGTRG